MKNESAAPRLKLRHLTWPMFIEEMTGGITAFTDTLFLSMISDEAGNERRVAVHGRESA